MNPQGMIDRILHLYCFRVNHSFCSNNPISTELTRGRKARLEGKFYLLGPFDRFTAETLHRAILRKNTCNDTFCPREADLGKTTKKRKLAPFQDYLSPSSLLSSPTKTYLRWVSFSLKLLWQTFTVLYYLN